MGFLGGAPGPADSSVTEEPLVLKPQWSMELEPESENGVTGEEPGNATPGVKEAESTLFPEISLNADGALSPPPVVNKSPLTARPFVNVPELIVGDSDLNTTADRRERNRCGNRTIAVRTGSRVCDRTGSRVSPGHQAPKGHKHEGPQEPI